MSDKTDAVAQARDLVLNRMHEVAIHADGSDQGPSSLFVATHVIPAVDSLIAAVRAECADRAITPDVVEAAYAEGYEDAERDPENRSPSRIFRAWKESRAKHLAGGAP